MDTVLGLKVANEEPATDEMELGPYRLTTLLWAPVQFVTVFGVLLYVSLSGRLGVWASGSWFVCGWVLGLSPARLA